MQGKSFIISVLVVIGVLNVIRVNNRQRPVPTEYVQKKIDRKEFKKQREEYINNMHRAHPDDDWQAMDKEVRKEKALTILNRRIQNSDDFSNIPSDVDFSFENNIPGGWDGTFAFPWTWKGDRIVEWDTDGNEIWSWVYLDHGDWRCRS